MTDCRTAHHFDPATPMTAEGVRCVCGSCAAHFVADRDLINVRFGGDSVYVPLDLIFGTRETRT